MENLLSKSEILISRTSTDYLRNLHSEIDWSDRMIGILGARGTGKTTILLQHLKLIKNKDQQSIYISLDDPYFMRNSLLEFVEIFSQKGGTLIMIDEVHKYPAWSSELKNIYDTKKEITIVFTGSSIIDIHKQASDLSRRAIQYELPGLSFREYLSIQGILEFESFKLPDILKNHGTIALEIAAKIKPILHFENYLKTGYYPFFLENVRSYPIRLEQIVKMVLETELRFIDGFDLNNIRKIYQLLVILASNVPFTPNISKLSSKIGINRNTLTEYIYYLEKAHLLNCLLSTGKSISTLQKPDKIYLENTNLHSVLSFENPEKGTLREAFFLNQLKNAKYNISLPTKLDFLVNEKWSFEIGGKNKTNRQLTTIKNAFIASDDIEVGALNKIPLWLFGFLY